MWSRGFGDVASVPGDRVTTSLAATAGGWPTCDWPTAQVDVLKVATAAALEVEMLTAAIRGFYR